MKRLLLAVLIMAALAINASAAGFTYYIDKDTETMCVSGIVSEKAPETVVIPSEINGIKVTKIENAVVVNQNGDVSFEPVDLKGAKRLIIPEGIERTGMFCGVENLETVVLPKSLKVLPSFAFAGAKNLKSINLEWIESISSFAFEGCVSLREVKLLYAAKVGTNSFNFVDNLTIYGLKDSAAQEYAAKNNVAFVKLSELERKAHKLYELGLMRGTGVTQNGILLFDLGRTPTRAEAVTMLIRFLGKEKQASKMSKTHPFTDVPSWADGYVSYAYEKGLANGISETLFGADTLATPEMYITFMLRALGYTDNGAKKDFSYENPWQLAMEKGIVQKDGSHEPFYRSEMVDMSYNALFANLKSGEQALFEKMISEEIFTGKMWECLQK